MAEHTKGQWGTLPAGPWELDHPDANWFTWCGIGPMGGEPVAIVMSERDDCEANAARIVACVNALEGYNPDVVRDVVEALRFYADENNPRPNEGPWGINSDDYGERARNALARLEGGAS